MRQDGAKGGFTLLEMLVVIAIMVIVVSGILVVGSHVRTSARVNNTRATLGILTAALREWQGATRRDFPQWEVSPPGPAPLDDDLAKLGNMLTGANLGPFTVQDTAPLGRRHGDYFPWKDGGDLVPGQQFDVVAARARSEFMWAFLAQRRESQAVLSKLSAETLVNEDGDQLQWAARPMVGLQEAVDAWGKPVNYVSQGAGNFPRLQSAGPDGVFGTADDVWSDGL